jgi:hypothetical protein
MIERNGMPELMGHEGLIAADVEFAGVALKASGVGGRWVDEGDGHVTGAEGDALRLRRLSKPL